MKIAVCIKQVPVVSMLKFDNESRRVIRDGVPSEINHFDLLGVCAALKLKEKTSVELAVFTMGPPQARDALVQCLATGAGRVVHLNDRAFAGSDTLATARALSLAIGREDFDLVICGRNSVDAETGQVGPEIAEMLGLPQVTGVRKLEFDEAANEVIVERVTDEGHDVIRCPLPALITVTEDVAEEIYPNRDLLEAAQDLPVEELKASDLSDDVSVFGQEGSPTWVSEIYSIESEREMILVRDASPEDAAEQLLDYLEKRGVFDKKQLSDASGQPRGPRREAGEVGPIWIVAELMGGEIRPATFELLGRASELAGDLKTNVEAILIGHNVNDYIPTLTAYGADCVHVADDECLAQYNTMHQTQIIAKAIKENKPYAVLFGSSAIGRDLASRIAARLQLGLTGDCIGLELDNEKRLVQLKPAFGGNIVAPILSKTLPYMATVRPGLLNPVIPDTPIEPTINRLSTGELGDSPVKIVESIRDDSAEGAELEHARIIVGVGMGVGGPENIHIAQKLARILHAPLGATRDLTDKGWLPRQYQIGLSGKAVSPELYVAVALRGPFNHTVGIQKAGTVVAINNSRRAQIFKAADFGILGDYQEVVPALIAAIEQRGYNLAD